ncbi:hypothetical protein LPJ72_000864 [Coemansia sp. Benny D160-2]|nr:hypothetical protein LPJ72_000864 [Coemansia sp. Benny D160-2]
MSASSHEYPTRNIQNTAQSKRMGHSFASELADVFDFLVPASTLGSDKSTLSKLSSRLQCGFAESSDVAAIDRSVGAIKQRVQRWFSSGEIWKSVFMKVEEVSDTLVEDAILDRSFEEADLAMIHAAGRLNGSISNAVDELAEALDRAYCTALTDKDTLVAADPSAVSSTMSALRGLALRKEPVNQFSLAKNVWNTRKELAESEILTSIPTYIRTSLAGFWAINAGSILASIGSLMYMGIPLVYTVSGEVAFVVLSLAWLGHRWRQLSASLYRHLDDRSAELSRKVLETHRLELWAQLDQPISKRIGKTPGIQELAPKSSNTSFENTNGALAANAASWRSQLEDIAPTRQSRIAVP